MLYKEWDINNGLAAIWKIDEPETFFAERTGLQTEMKNERRRTEHLAGRYLLKHLEADFPLHHIHKDEHDKPRVPGNEYHFSISHSWPYIAAVIDPYSDAGIDIQTWHPRIGLIQHKFLSPQEQEFFGNDPQLLTLAWCAKEAVYKWHGKRGVDFINHLPIEFFEKKGDFYYITIYFKFTKIPQMISLESFVNADFACTYVTNAQQWAIY